MLTDGKILELFDATGGGIVGRLSRFARAIEAEVLQTQEPAGEIIMYAPCGKLSATFARPEWRGGALPPVGTKLYTAPQPPAPCPKCAEFERISNHRMKLCDEWAGVSRKQDLEIISLEESVAELEQFKQMWAISCAERDALQAKVSEQRAEIERLNRGLTVYTEAFEAECRTTDEQDALIDVLDLCERFIIAVASDYPVSSKPVLAAITSHRKGIAK